MCIIELKNRRKGKLSMGFSCLEKEGKWEECIFKGKIFHSLTIIFAPSKLEKEERES